MGEIYPTLPELYAMHRGNLGIQTIIANMMLPAGTGGVTGVKHYNLSFLNWSQAAHTFDTDLDVGAYALKGANVYASSLTTNTIVYAAASGQLKSVTLGSSLTFASPPTLNTIQDIRTSASPIFHGLSLSSLSRYYMLYVKNGSGDIGTIHIIGNLQLNLANETLDIVTSPSFSGLTIGTLSGVLKASTGVVSGSSTSTDLLDGNSVPAANLETRLARELLDVNYYSEVAYSGGLISTETYYTDSTKAVTLVKETYSYS